MPSRELLLFLLPVQAAVTVLAFQQRVVVVIVVVVELVLMNNNRAALNISKVLSFEKFPGQISNCCPFYPEILPCLFSFSLDCHLEEEK